MQCYVCGKSDEACHVLIVSPFTEPNSILHSFRGERVPLCSTECLVELVKPTEDA